MKTILNNQLWILFWTSAEKLVQFLFIFLNTLLSLLVRPPIVNRNILNVNQTYFETLTKIVQHDLLAGLNDTHGRNHLLLAYIHYECILHTPTEIGYFK
ncbi:unnamed protein product [Rotaria sp. Silwood2]|nr:unnamed protein product [Rotaria sp. Silwood2]CAF4481593.1 unnamed protein product [Rotaria sp. Silwood2]